MTIDPRKMASRECEWVVNEIEDLKLKGVNVTAAEVSGRLTEEARKHVAKCSECANAVEDFVVTREALVVMKETLREPGPWFAVRVMAAIKAAENELEEKSEGVWISVRRLAPRMAAFAVLLLVLGGTWAMELRHQERSAQQSRQVEGLFEGVPGPANDDIVASINEGRQP
jgi:hypothetical protein